MWGYIIVSLVTAICVSCIFRYKRTRGIISGDLYEKIIHAVPDMIFIFDNNLRIVKFYNIDEKKSMIPEAQLINSDLKTILDKKFIALIEEGIRNAHESDKVHEIEYHTEGPEMAFYEGRFIRIRKNRVACFVRDITERKKAELTIEQHKDLLNMMLDNIPIPIILKDVDDDLRYIYWNKECDLQGGLSHSETLGKTDIDIYGEERGKKYQEVDRQIIARKAPYRNREIYTTPDGKEHISVVYKNLISNDLHRWMLGVRWDVTELTEAESSVKQINKINQLILNNSNSGLVFLSPDYFIEWENISTYSRHHIARKYKTGTQCYRSVKGADSPCPGCVVPLAIASGKKEQKEVIFDDGTVTELTATPTWNEKNELQGIVLKVEDITTKKQAARELEQAKEEAEKSDRLKSAFLANMSHEIRTPLNAILGFSELLGLDEESDEKDKYIEIIKSNSDLLLQLINDILDLSKIEANTLEFTYTEVDINNLLQELQHATQLKISNNPKLKISFTPGLPHCSIYTEKNRISQVISNFITNALKFTEEGEITLGYRQTDDGLHFFVSDTGAGIPKDKQKEIFNRFTKLDSFKTGTGLGLAISLMIIQKLNGKIGVDSEPGKGSTFWFTIPCKVGQSPSDPALTNMPATSPDPLVTSSSDKPTLLIAEDVPDNYKLYQIFLGKKYNLIHARNGKEAVEFCEKYNPELILMDIKMPGMNGYEATSAIRQTNSKVPIIAVTAFAFADDKKQILESGFNDYLCKPITFLSINGILEKYLKKLG